jgi:hypothetical protein
MKGLKYRSIRRDNASTRPEDDRPSRIDNVDTKVLLRVVFAKSLKCRGKGPWRPRINCPADFFIKPYLNPLLPLTFKAIVEAQLNGLTEILLPLGLRL